MMKKIYRLVSVILFACMIAGIIPVKPVYAEEVNMDSQTYTQDDTETSISEVVEETKGTDETQQELDVDSGNIEETQNAGDDVSVEEDNEESQPEQEASAQIPENTTDDAIQTNVDQIVIGEIEYVYVESPYLSTPNTQRILYAFDREITGADTITISVADSKGNVEDWNLTKQSGNLYLFEKYYSGEAYTDVYHVVSLNAKNSESEQILSMADLDIEVLFGVNKEYDGIEELEPLDPEEATENSDEIETYVATIDENGVAEAQDDISSALKAAEQDMYGGISAYSRSSTSSRNARSGNIVVALDPGHDAQHTGAAAFGLYEHELTLKIATYCKEELEQYAGVTVYMTRTTDDCAYGNASSSSCLSLRSSMAAAAGADIFVSIHINSATASSANGAEVIVPNYNGNYTVGAEGHALAEKILSELVALGLNDRGIYSKNSANGTTYADGSAADYFSVIYNNKLNGIPGIIVEHAFISNSNDVNRFLSSETGLKQLGIADATGIAQYLGLSKGYWETDSSGKKYYYENGQKVTGEKRIGSDWYYFDPADNGAMVTGWHNFTGKTVYYGADGAMCFGEYYVDGFWRYFNPANGALWTGWCDLPGKRVYYNSDGEMIFGEKAIDGKWYYFSERDGAMVTGWYDLPGKRVYYDESGAMQFGEKNIDGHWYLLSPKDGAMVTGWYDFPEKRVYYDTDGAMLFGEQKIEEKWYLFSEKDGAMVTGWYDLPEKRVYYDVNGAMLFGEQKIEEKWYYLNPADGALLTGLQKISDGYRYYLPEGGWLTGEYSVDGKWYCFRETDGMAITGWYDLPGKRVYYDENGVMQFGEKYIDGEWYLLSLKDGAMVTGWYDFPNKRVYYNSSGKMIFGSQLIGGERYYFDPKDGKMLTNVMIDDVYYGSDGAAINNIVTYRIEGESVVTIEQMVSFYEQYSPIVYPSEKLALGGAATLREFAQIFYEEAVKENIKVEVAWAQTMLETGYLQFGGQVKIEQFNFAGLGATDGGASGADFSSYGADGVRIGVRAQIQHLKAYASSTITKDKLSEVCVDPRFDLVVPKGCAQYVEYLGQQENPDGKGWATSAGYGYYILQLIEKIIEM